MTAAASRAPRLQPPTVACRARNDYPSDYRACDRVQKVEEFLELVQSRVRDIDYVLVGDGEMLRQEIRLGVAEIEPIDNG